MAILRTLPAAVAVAALTATLVGCGSSDVRDERDQALMERDEAQAELDQTQTERDQAQADLEAAQAEAEAAQAELDAAQAEAEERLEMERMRAEEAAAEAAAAAEQALKEAEQARMDEEAARMEAEGERDTLQEAADKAAAATASATAKALLASLGDVDPDRDTIRTVGTDAGTRSDPNPDTFPVFDGTLYTKNLLVATLDALDTTTAGNNNVRAAVTASSKGEAKVAVTGYTPTDTVPDMIKGFRGVELTEGTKTLQVYTDIEDATATAGAGATVLDASYASTSTPGKLRMFSVTDDGAGNTIDWSDVVSDAAVSTTTTTTGGTTVVASSFEGSVKGVSGTFSCSAAIACTAPDVNGVTGELTDTAAATGWSFTPDPAAEVDVMDGDGYLAFGWWLNKRGMDQPSGEQMNVDVFAQAYGLRKRMTPVTANTTELAGYGGALTGMAKYTGGAAGKYAIAETTTNSADGGHFTAMANFTANFDADADGNDADGNDKTGISLTGTIDNFMTGDMSRDWTVTLAYDENTGLDGSTTAVPAADLAEFAQSPITLGDIATGATINAAGACTTADCSVARASWDTGGAVKGSGRWTASYHGGTKASDHPTAVVGEFNANIGSVARIIGAFGATMMMDDM